MTASKYEVVVDVNARNAVAELEKLKAATERVGKASKDTMAPGVASAAKAQVDAAAAAKANAEQLNKNLTAAAAVGAAFSTLSAQLGPLGSALGASASAAGAMFAAFGPAGAAIGAVAGALPGLITLVKDLGNESRTSAQKIEDLRDRIRDTASAYLDAASSARDWRSALEGLLPLEEQQARLQAARAEQIRLRGAIAQVERQAARAGVFAGGASARIAENGLADLRRQLAAVSREAEGLATGAGRALERETNEARFAEAQAEAEAIRAKNEAQRASAESAAEQRQERMIAAKQKLLDIERMIVDEAARLAEQESAALKELERRRMAEEDILRLKQEQADINSKAAESARLTAIEDEERTQKLTQSQKDGAELERERTQIEEDRIRITSRASAGMEGILDIAQRTAQIQKETNASFGEAFKTAVDEWLKGFALQEAYKGVAATAEAIGSAVTNQPNAAAKFAEAGIHFALAAAAGGASAAIPNGGGGGGGGGGGRRQGPEPVGGGASGGGGGTVVVNFNAPVAEAEIGRQQERASRAARRRFGS